MKIDELETLHQAWVTERKQRQRARAAFLAMIPREFAQRVCEASCHKLRPARSLNDSTLAFSAEDLMPVTHFKKLARLGTWNRRRQCFEYALPLGEGVRDALVEVATALGKSKKVVTREDLDARRVRNNRDAGKLDMDFAECLEDFGYERAMEMLKEGLLLDGPDEIKDWDDFISD